MPFGKGFGEKGARRALQDCIREEVPVGARVRFGVVHVGVPEIVASVTAELRATWGDRIEVLSAPATPVIATHLGIGAWGLAYMVED